MKLTRLFLLVIAGISFEFCIAQPFTPIPLGGKSKKQNLILPLPPTTTTTGCSLEIGATNAVTANGVTTVSIGTTGTKTFSDFTATKIPDKTADVTATTVWVSSDPTVASITATTNAAGKAVARVTGLKAGTTQVGPSCDPSTRVEVKVTAGAVPNTLEIRTASDSNIQIEADKNKETQNED